MIFLTSKTFEAESLPLKEHWYKIDYNVTKYNEAQIKLMSEPSVRDNGKKLDLPPPNNLIPSNF